MADGRHLLPHLNSATNHIANSLLLSSILGRFTPEPSSPSQSPALGSQGQTLRGMYGQNHQQAHNSRLNGAHPHQQHAQHHQSMQPDHAGHGSGAGLMGPSTFSGGVMPNSSPFSGSNMQNGHATTTRGGQAQALNEHWAEQLRLRKEAERAHIAMTEQHQPHYYARLKAADNRGIGGSATTPGGSAPAADGEDDRRRPYNLDRDKRQDWHNIDMSGQGLRILAPTLFRYDFLKELYIASNKLTHLPSDIGRLRHLTILEASNNLLTELPPEIGMCTNLKNLFLFDNQISTLPYELGSLYLLDMLGIEGNPLNPKLKDEIVERGTKALINTLREQAPGQYMAHDDILEPANSSSSHATLPEKTGRDSGRCVPKPRKGQGHDLEHPLREVCHGDFVRLYSERRSVVGLPKRTHYG